jgi:hypothetical protein
MSGATTYDENKTAELILYVAEQTELDETAGAIKLNKVLYFAELTHMRRVGVPITGADYQKLPMGPGLRRMLPIRDRLLQDGDAKMVKRDYFGSMRSG